MKNKIVLSYRFILVYYLLAFLIVIININHLERVLIYSLILIVLFGIVVHIYILNIPKLLLSNKYIANKYIEKNLSTVKEAIDKIHNKSINDSLITIYIFLLEISNYKEEYQNFVEQNSKRIFDEKQNRHWYTIKLQYYYNLNKKDEYLKLYDPQLDNKVKNPLFKIMYLILNEEYEEALELSKKVTSQQKDIGYIMKLYYRIICLEHLEKENELNDCINEMVEFNDQIHYVKEIKDKYKK
mgnify:FL=1